MRGRIFLRKFAELLKKLPPKNASAFLSPKITSYSLKKHGIVRLNFSSFTIYQQFNDIMYLVSVCAHGICRLHASLWKIHKTH